MRGMTMMDNLWIWLVWHAPRRFLYWAAVRVIAHATTGEHSKQIVPNLLAMEALDRWEPHR